MAWNKLSRSSSVSFSSQSEDKIPPWLQHGNTVTPCYRSLWNISLHYVGRSRKHNKSLLQVTLKHLTTLCGEEEETQWPFATSHFETSHHSMWGGAENTMTTWYKSLWNVSPHYVGRRRKHNSLLQVTLKRLTALCGEEEKTQRPVATNHFETSHCTMWWGGENTTTLCYKSLWNVLLHYVGRSIPQFFSASWQSTLPTSGFHFSLNGTATWSARQLLRKIILV